MSCSLGVLSGYAVLGLCGMESAFPIAAIIVLCFVFAARMVLITHPCFGCY